MTAASRCTPAQAKAIATLDAPLIVSAGAGSGKTFTLTQRIAGAFDRGLIDSISQVCAITYTRKAAGELRSRVRALLSGMGRLEEARAVDDAWMTTIHGMAARILREHALEIGVDPSFEVLDEDAAADLARRAADEVAELVDAQGRGSLPALLRAEPLFGSGRGARGLMDDARAVLARAHAMPQGLDGVAVPQPDAGADSILGGMAELAEEALAAIASWEKRGKKDEEHAAALQGAVEGYRRWREAGPVTAFGDGAFDAEAFRDALYAFPPTTAKYRVGKEGEEAFARYRSGYVAAVRHAESALGAVRAAGVVQLARMVDERFSQLKGPARLDDDDLLRLCFRALSDHPELAEGYRRRFRMIMVDEFQDTDRLQVAIIALIAAPDMSNVCTVGDVQQSIYRFRGADVNVLGEHRRALLEGPAEAVEVELPDNFRSHGDVLKLVDKLFAGPGMFGDAFLHLEPRGAVNSEPDPAMDGIARAAVSIIHFNPRRKGSARTADARRANAERIAGRFAELHARGVPAHDMAILLGSMANARIYADALRAVGLDSMVTGGSTFGASDEVALVRALLAFARDRFDDGALFQVLASPLFAISDDVLLALASRLDGGIIRRARLSEGFAAGEGELLGMLSEEDRQALAMARGMLGAFAARARSGDAEGALRGLLLQSGILDRWQGLGASGLAAAGNMEKACCLVGSLQRGATGIATLSESFDAHVDSAKERPGLLVPNEGDLVTLITIHGSKGLEYPHVAVAELPFSDPGPASFAAENIGGSTVVACCMKPGGGNRKAYDSAMRLPVELDIPELRPGMPFDGLWLALDAHRAQQEADERKRLLYVALTRAVRSVYLTALLPFDPDAGYAGRGLAEPVHEALGWPADAASSVTMVPLGGGAQAEVRVERMEAPEEDPGAQPPPSDGEAPFEVPVRELPAMPHLVPGAPAARDAFSYTSLSARDAAPQPAASAADPGADREAATDLGTAFHRLAQRAIILADARQAAFPVAPDGRDIGAQVRSLGLSAAQAARLEAACGRWFSSSEARAFFACADKAAEVPFSVRVEDDAGSFYLVGEIDGLARSGESALLIDYKTGGAAGEDAQALHAKHLFQAQCYAYALIEAGFQHVDARFIRVEQPAADDPAEPQAVAYSFAAADRDALHHIICEAHRYAIAHA